jgi:hypothetical protein
MLATIIFRIGFGLCMTVATLPPAKATDAFRLFKSVDVDLPSGEPMFPDGRGADTINNNCPACDSADMVLNQPAPPKKAWRDREPWCPIESVAAS